MKKNLSLYRIIIVLAIVMFVMSLLVLLINPVAGAVLVAVSVFLFIFAKKKSKAIKLALAAPIVAPVLTEEKEDSENIKVAGVSFFQDAIRSLGERNSEYDYTRSQIQEEELVDQDIFEYDFPILPAGFKFEPENEHDPNAIAIYVKGVKIGYVKSGSTSHIRNLINSGRLVGADCIIRGGNSKYYDSEEKELTTDEGDFHAKVHLKLKSE